MRRGLPALAALGIVALLTFEHGGALAADADPLVGSPAEQEALQSVDAGKLIRAREQAEAILDEDPGSIIGNYVLAHAFVYEEGNNPRGLFLIRQARRLLEARYGEAPTDERARTWHKRLFVEESFILGYMDRRIEQLAVMDAHDALYQPPLDRRRVWPLMKLGRYDEAREIGERLARDDDIYARISGYNGLMAMESERLEREASYRMGRRGVTATQGRSCVLHHNLALGALETLRFGEVEELARAAMKADIQDCPNSSYSLLAQLYLLQGQFQKAISALEQLKKNPPDKQGRQQFRMGNRAILATLLYALGKFGEGEEIARQTHKMPDRAGMVSESEDEYRLAHGLNFWMQLEGRMEQLREKLSVRPFSAWFSTFGERQLLRFDQFTVERNVMQLAARGDGLMELLLPYVRHVKPWYVGAVIRMVGPGLTERAVKEARQKDRKMGDRMQAYYDALEGEIAWVQGDDDGAWELGRRALRNLPREAVLLAWRTRAWMADALHRSGRDMHAWKHYQEVLQHYPTALRHLGIAIPVVLTSSGSSELVATARVKLAGSRRLQVTESSELVVDVSGGADGLEICIQTRSGYQFHCEATEREDGEEGSDFIVRALDLFHDRAFSPKVELTQSDINSLDGSPVRVNADAVLEEVLK